mgnify:CR=1 FL=1
MQTFAQEIGTSGYTLHGVINPHRTYVTIKPPRDCRRQIILSQAA